MAVSPEPEPTTTSDGIPRKKKRGKQMRRIEESWLKRPYVYASPFGKAVLEGCFKKGISLLALREFVSNKDNENRTIGDELFRRVLQGKSKMLHVLTIYNIASHLGLDPVELGMLYMNNLEQANMEGYEFEFLWNEMIQLPGRDRRLLHVIIMSFLEENRREQQLQQITLYSR